MKHTWKLQTEMQEKFLTACRNAGQDENAFKNFRSDPEINCIVENTPQSWADAVIEDGVPFEQLSSTPTQVRYMYTTTMIHKLCCNTYGKHIVEIGGGYGGLAEAIYQSGEVPTSYTIYDHLDVSFLQRRYLRDYRMSKYFFIEIDPPMADPDLCIAWCSWSELNDWAKQEYIKVVMKRSEHLFLAVNWDYDENLCMLLEHFPDLKIHEDKHLGKIIYR